MNDFNLNQLTTVNKSDSIFDVIGKMQIFYELASHDEKLKRHLPFHYTYLLITKAVAEIIYSKKAFKNEKELQKLDVIFATKYYNALHAYLVKGEKQTPWINYFKYLESDDYKPFTSLLLGINSHINGDLGLSLLEAHYLEYKKDFNYVNKVLRAEIPKVLKYIAIKQKDLLGIAAFVFKDISYLEFEKVIVSWRKFAWIDMEMLHKKSVKESEIHAKAEDVAIKIETVMHIKESINLPKFLKELENLKVS